MSQILFKITEEEKKLIEDVSKQIGLSVSAFVRSLALRECRKYALKEYRKYLAEKGISYQ